MGGGRARAGHPHAHCPVGGVSRDRHRAGYRVGRTGTASEAGRHVPGSAVGGIRAGALRTGTADGEQWAIASLIPARSAAPQLAAAFQDGAATGVFTETGASWHLVSTGFYG